MKHIYDHYKLFNLVRKKLPIYQRFDFNPNSSALLVIDLQNYFLDEKSHAFVPASLKILTNINKLVKLYDNSNLCIVFTKHIDKKSKTSIMKRWWQDSIEEDSLSSTISDKVYVPKNSFIVVKSQYDAFYKTNLYSILRKNKIKQILITGVLTHLCCETTARAAFTRNFEVFLVIDGTATYNKNFYLSTLFNLLHGFAQPILTSEIIKEFKLLSR